MKKNLLLTLMLICALFTGAWAATGLTSITITTGATTAGCSFTGTAPNRSFVLAAGLSTANIQASALVAELLINNVTISTTSATGTGTGDVTISTAVTAASTSTTQRTLTITAGSIITITSAGSINLTPSAATGGTNPGSNITFTAANSISIAGAITTTGNVKGNTNGGAGGSVSLTATTGNVSVTALITATGCSPGSGNGNGGNGGNITLSGNTGIRITANLSAGAGAGHGSGNAGTDGDFTVNDGATTVTTGGGVNDGQTAGVIDGDQLTKNGTGTFYMAGANTYTGSTTISAGTLKLGANNAFGTTAAGTTITSGAVLDLNGVTYSTAEALTVNGTGISGNGAIINSSATAATYSGLLTLGSASTITSANGTIGIINTGTIAGSGFGLTLDGSSTGFPTSEIVSNIGTGAGTLTKNGTGTWTLGDPISLGGAQNTFTGLTTINNGILKFGNSAGSASAGPLGTTAAGTVVNNGGALDLAGWSEGFAEALTLNGTGSGGGGALRNSGGGDTYAGLITLGSSSTISGSGGTLAITNTGTITGAGFTLTLAGAQGGSVASIIGTTTGGVSKFEAGTWTLTGVNTYTGVTTISAGILSVATIGAGGTAGNLGAAAATAGNLVLSGGTLQYTGATAFSNRIITLTAATSSTIDVTTNTLTLTGAMPATTGALTKVGAGTLILSGANAYTGTTTISAGTLTLGTTGVISNSSDIDMDGGTFKTGATTGFTETVGTLNLTDNSTLALGTGSHTITFAASNTVTWGAFTLLITGWTGGYDGTASATAGRVFVGGAPGNGLTAGQLAQIFFVDPFGNNIAAVMLSTGEIVPGYKIFYARATGNWNLNTTWAFTSGGAAVGVGVWPLATDVVYIGEAASFTVTIATGRSEACSTLNIGNNTAAGTTGGTLNFTNATSSLTVGNNLTILLGSGTGTATSTIGVGAGTLTVNGNLELASHTATSTSTTRVNSVTISTGTVTVGGDLIFDAQTGAAQQSQVVFSGAGNLNYAGAFTLTNGVGTFTPATSTVTLNGTGTQNIPAFSYNNLTISGTYANANVTLASGTINMTGNFTANSNFTGTGAYVVTGNTVNLSGTGAQAINGTDDAVFNIITVNNPTGTITLNTNVSAASFTAVVTSAALSVSGTNALNLSGTFALNNSPTAAVSYSVTGAGAISAATVTVGGSTTPTGAGTFTTTLTSTIASLTTSGSFTLLSTFSGTKINNPVFNLASGTTTVGTTGIGGSLIMNNNAGTGTSTIALNNGAQTGKLVLSGTPAIVPPPTGTGITNFNGTSAVVDYNGTAAQSVLIPTTAYTTLKINNANASGATLPSSVSTTNITIGDETANSIFNDANGLITVVGSGTFNLVSGTFNYGLVSFPVFTTNTILPGTTVNYTSASTQVIATLNYGNLSNSGNGGRVFIPGTVGVFNTFTPSTGGNNVSGGSTVDFNGTGAQTVPAFSYYNLTISNAHTSNNVTLVNGGTINIAGDFTASATFTSGNYVVINNTVNFNGTTAQTIGGTGIPTLNIMNISNVTAPTSLIINTSTNAATLNFIASPTVLSVSNPQTLTVSGTLTVNNAAAAAVTATITGLGAVSAGAVAIGNNTALTANTTTFATTLTSTITTFGVTGNVTLNGYFTATNRINNPVFDFQSGTLTIGGAITTVNANAANTSTLTTSNGAQSGTLILTNATPFNLSGTGANAVTFSGTTATVVYKGTALQTALGTTYTNVKIQNPGNTVQLAGNATIGGTLDLTSGKLAINGQTLSLNGTVINATLGNSITADPSATLNIGGTSATSIGTLYFDPSGTGQEIGNLTMSRSGGSVTFATYLTVDNVLTLTNGFITTGANYLIIQSPASTAIVAGAGNTTFTNSWVNGNLTRFYTSGSTATYTFPVGDGVHGHLASISTNALAGTGVFNASFVPVHNGTNSQVSAYETSIAGNYHTAYNTINAVGFWDIGGFTRTSGTYDISLYTNGASPVLIDNSFGVLERPLSPTPTSYATFKPAGGTLNANNGLGRKTSDGYALRKGLTSFGEFGIGQSSAVLPIQLTAFTAQKEATNSNNVVLQWNTASELNNNYFELQVATSTNTNDGSLMFSKLGEVAGNGTTDIAHNYSFVDNTPDKSGVRYYRLMQVDMDGTATYSDIKALSFESNTVQVTGFYPNPVNDVLHFNINAADEATLTVTITNMVGQEIFSNVTSVSQGNNQFSLDTRGLSKGMYLINVTNGKDININNKIEKF